MSKIRTARENLDEFKRTWDERKRAEYQDASALHRLAVYQAVWEAHERGETVSQICREYGTKDRRTIMDIISKRHEYNFDGSVQEDGTVIVEAVPNSDGYPNTHRVTVRNWLFDNEPYTGSVVVYPTETSGDNWLPVRFVPESVDDIGGPLQVEIMAWLDDSVIVQAIKSKMMNL